MKRENEKMNGNSGIDKEQIQKLKEQYPDLFEKIVKTGLSGRMLELFFPLIIIADMVSEEVLNKTLDYAKKFPDKRLKETFGYAQRFSNKRKIKEATQTADIFVYETISKEPKNTWRGISDLVSVMKRIGKGEYDWINTKWLGRALKRLNLIKHKRRMSSGMQVILDVEKAKKKIQIWKPSKIMNDEKKYSS